MIPGAWSAALLAGAAMAWSTPPSRRSLRPGRPTGARRSRGGPSLADPRSRRLVAAGAGLVTVAVVGGPTGLLLGIATTVVAAQVLGRLESRAGEAWRRGLSRDLPLAGDLLAATLAAGTPQGSALSAVGAAIGGPLGAELARVARALDLGQSPTAAWTTLLDVPATARLARPLVRAAERGAAPAAALARSSTDLRSAARSQALEAVEVVAVRAVGPLGVCFLPGFVLLAVVPLIAGSALALLGPDVVGRRATPDCSCTAPASSPEQSRGLPPDPGAPEARPARQLPGDSHRLRPEREVHA